MNKIYNINELEPINPKLVKCCLYGNGNSYYLWNSLNAYYNKLDLALDDIIAGYQKDYLFFSFIAICSATLEYSLNMLNAFYYFDKFENKQDFESHMKTYSEKTFRHRLNKIPELLSGNYYKMNNSCKYVKNLYELIKKRNMLLHNSEVPHIFKFPDIHEEKMKNGLFIPMEYSKVEIQISVKENPINTLTRDECVKIGNAMLAFYKQIMIPYINNRELVDCEFLSHK